MLAFFELSLIAVTWRIWIFGGEVPRIPLFAAALPASLSLAASAVLAIGCISILLDVISRRACRALVEVLTWMAGFLCALANQQCLQAWHWLFLLSLGLWLLTNQAVWPNLMRQVFCTIYVCSALSRLTLTPGTGMTAVIARQLLQWVGVSEFRQADLLPGLCHGLSLGEFAIGILLLFDRSRLPGIVAAECLHLTLLLVLGPAGLNHHAGVLIWNMCLIAMIPLVFPRSNEADRVPRNDASTITQAVHPGFKDSIATTMIWLWPLSGLFGFADNWPSWQLYSNRPEIWTLYVQYSEAKLLPESVRGYLGEAGTLEDFLPVRLDRWVLHETGCPMYPEDRFQLAIIEWCVRDFPMDAEFEVRVSEPQMRWWQRRQRVLRGRAELDLERTRMVLNSAV
ncbi:MAG: hypothetical protein ACK58L_08815, partial [Planctomycetota bacterium]